MIDRRLEESLWLLARARGVGIVLRVLIVVSPLAALACTRFAADDTLLVINIPVIALALWCVVFPESHVGLVIVLLVATEWLVTVDDRATPWSIGVAASLTAFHAALAAATVAPSAARWTRPMCQRWLRRAIAVVLASAATWLMVAGIDGYDVASSEFLVAAALVSLAVAAMWARDGRLVSERGPRA